MKRIYLLTIIFFFSLIVRAVNVEIDGIMYNINAKTGLTEVVANPSHQYKGDIVIPEAITYEGKEYTVTGYDEVNKLVWLQNPLTQPIASHYLPLSKFNEFFGGYRYQPEEKEVETDLYKPWPRDCYEYVKDNTYHVPNRGPYVYEDTAYEAIDLAKREVAQEIIDLYNEGKAKTVDEILHHCYEIVDF